MCMPIFQALSDEHRLEILFLLLEARRLNVKEISSHMNISRPAISHHLKILRLAGIVKFTKVGTQKYYTMNGDAENPLVHLKSMAEAMEFYI